VACVKTCWCVGRITALLTRVVNPDMHRAMGHSNSEAWALYKLPSGQQADLPARTVEDDMPTVELSYCLYIAFSPVAALPVLQYCGESPSPAIVGSAPESVGGNP
jgi:hypothetical protein